MTKPQQPELERSGHTPVDQTRHAKEVADSEPLPGSEPVRPVPEDNRPGQRSEHDQDKPDLERFRQRLRGDAD
ncbi:MAG TPA: hypothetical protein VG452_09670 [Egibacteraceae bacterium]|nr:hypothetical protein [Egibacteraceae bacterium]